MGFYGSFEENNGSFCLYHETSSLNTFTKDKFMYPSLPPETRQSSIHIIRWVDGTNDSSSKHLMFQAYPYRLMALNTLYSYLRKCIKRKKNETIF